MRTENKMNEISSTECAVEALLMLSGLLLYVRTHFFVVVEFDMHTRSLRLNEKYFDEQRFGSQSMLSS